METIDRRVYQKPMVNVVKIDTVQHINASEATEGGTGSGQSREFRNSFFEEDD